MNDSAIPKCECTSGFYKCVKGSEGPVQATIIRTGDTVLELTGNPLNAEEYILQSEELFPSLR